MKIFIDWDGCIYDFAKSFTTLYNKKYNDNMNVADLKYYDLRNFKHIKNKKQILELFDLKEMYSKNNFYFGAVDFLNNNYKDISIVTIGNVKNLYHKMLLKNKLFPNVNFIGLESNDIFQLNKQEVNMQNSIFIDDKKDNLISSNAKYKILYDPNNNYWNKNWKGIIVKNWAEVELIVRILNLIEQTTVKEQVYEK